MDLNTLQEEVDKDIKIKWPIKKPILSKRDSNSKPFKELDFKK